MRVQNNTLSEKLAFRMTCLFRGGCMRALGGGGWRMKTGVGYFDFVAAPAVVWILLLSFLFCLFIVVVLLLF